MAKLNIRLFLTIILIFIAQFIKTMTENGAVFGQNWPQWRGPLSSGASPEGNPPMEWDEHRNIKWKIEIPGTGYILASPVGTRNQIYIVGQ
jgi:hypothetical protein